MLRPDPVTRPTMHEIYQDEFFRSGYLPTTLPPSSLSMAPRFNTSILESKPVGVAQKDTKGVDVKGALQRRPLFEINHLQPAAAMAKPEENRRRSHAMHVVNGESRLMTCEEAKKHGLGEDEGQDLTIPLFTYSQFKQTLKGRIFALNMQIVLPAFSCIVYVRKNEREIFIFR